MLELEAAGAAGDPGAPGDEATTAERRAVTDPHELKAELAALEAVYERVAATVEMHYQPIVRAKAWTEGTPSLFGYEALLRTRDRSLPHPGALLDAAERLERLTRLSRHLRALVARDFAAAPAVRGVAFVNLHGGDLFDKTLVSPLSPLTRVAHRVVLELTERHSFDGLGDIRYRVAELRELGFRIAVDDLGGGHARMNHIQPSDTDFVKLDMSLVRDVHAHPVKQRLVESITSLCRDRGILVIGEGVETAAEAECLLRLGCDLFQGYLVARPAPPFCDV